MNNFKGFEKCDINFIEDINNLQNGGYLIEVSDNASLGFNYPYLLFIPTNVNVDSRIIVEGANTDKAVLINDLNDDKNPIAKSISEVKRNFSGGHPIKKINEETANYPFLYPLFPRLRYKDKSFYNHMLSSNTMFLEETEKDAKKLGIYRTDLQLIEMINDARNRLEQQGLNIDEKVIMYGFSASAKFVNRFTLLHPEIVKCAFAAAMGGTITLPLGELNGEKLLWPLGIGNVEEITGEKLEIYKKNPQFYLQGLLDTNDCYKPNDSGTCRYEGILQDDEAIQMYKFLGKSMNEERWPKTNEIISTLDSSITLLSCDDDHKPHMLNDVIKEKLNEMSKNKQL